MANIGVAAAGDTTLKLRHAFCVVTTATWRTILLVVLVAQAAAAAPSKAAAQSYSSGAARLMLDPSRSYVTRLGR